MAGRKNSDSKEIGGISVAGVSLALKLAKKKILLPPDDNLRFDLAIYESGTQIKRVQCKTGHLINGAVVFRSCSNKYHYRAVSGVNYGRRGYKGDAEYFGVYCLETGKSYLVPVDDVGDSAVSLRIEPTKNNQISRVRWAKDYEILSVSIEELERKTSTDDTVFTLSNETSICECCGSKTPGRRARYCYKCKDKALGTHRSPVPPCEYCGSQRTNTGSKYCTAQCSVNASRKVKRPTKEELEIDIDSMSWIAIGKKYGVTDNAAKKWARKYEITIPRRRHCRAVSVDLNLTMK